MFIRIHYFKKNALENLFVIINVQMSTLVKFFPFKKEFFPLSFCTVNTTLWVEIKNNILCMNIPLSSGGNSVWGKISKNIDLKAFECGFSKLRGYFQISQCYSRNILKVQVSVTSPSKTLFSLLCFAAYFAWPWVLKSRITTYIGCAVLDFLSVVS